MTAEDKRPDGMVLFYQDWQRAFRIFSDTEIAELLRALFDYFTEGKTVSFSERSQTLFYEQQVETIDRQLEQYRATCERNARNAKKKQTSQPETDSLREMLSYPVAPGGTQWQPTETETGTGTETETGTETVTGAGKKPPSAKESPAHLYGEYKRVKLTDAEYERLLNELGREELERCIRYVDESAQKTGNKNKWKDWNLVIRNCHREGWGLGFSAGRSETGKGSAGRSEGPKARNGPGVKAEDAQNFLKYGI